MTPSKSYRIVTFTVGIILVVIAAWIIFRSYPPDIFELLAVLVLLLLGGMLFGAPFAANGRSSPVSAPCRECAATTPLSPVKALHDQLPPRLLQ